METSIVQKLIPKMNTTSGLRNLMLGLTTAATGVAVISTIYYVAKKSHIVPPAWPNKKQGVAYKLPRRRIVVVNTFAECEKAMDEFLSEITCEKVIGLDCEWCTGNSHQVALLQLASPSGLCVLIRLCQMNNHIPQTLVNLLQDKSIIKAGVACLNDGKRLCQDYGLVVRGCVDLRHLVMRHRPLKDGGGLGLKELSKRIIGIELDKSKHTRCSDWEAEELSPQQIEYAALDAFVSMAIFCEIVWQKVLQFCGNPSVHIVYQKAQSMCQGIVDVDYNNRHDSPAKVKRTNNPAPPESRAKPTSRAYSSRSRPLYHNCQLRAPDGQMLCTCDTKKAEWYIHKGLGVKISDDPFTVQLIFEPSGRPLSMKNYYIQEKTNLCVVCGRTDSYVRKHIIPKEYRKHFPAIMKDHLSHDILLLCTSCHQHSTVHDDLLRDQFARMCDAPIGSETGLKYKQDPALQQVRSAAKALLRCADEIPAERRVYLECVVKDYYGVSQLDGEILKEMAGIETKVEKADFVAHGEKVVQYMLQRGALVQFEKTWRQHFVDKMQPQYLPVMWSVDHNHARLQGLSQDLTHAIQSS